MGVLDQEKVDRIKLSLKLHPRGMTISNLSSKMKMNRNLIAKYLDMLLISGQVSMEIRGAAKVYYSSHRVPISAMLEFSSDLVIVLDSERRIVQVNEAILALLNEKRDALLGKRFDEIDNPFLRDLPISSQVETGEQVTEMSSVLRGERYYFRVKQVPTAFEDGSQGTTLIIEDTTTQMKYRLMLEMKEAKYRGIVEDQTEFICRFLPDFTITFANLAYTNYVGVPYESLKGTSILSFIGDEDVRAMKNSIASLTPEKSISTCEIHDVISLGDARGIRRWQSWTFHGLFDGSGQLLEIQGTGRDITTEKELAEDHIKAISEQKLHDCEERYRTLVQHLNMGLYRSTGDPQGRFLWGNAAFINILGYNSMLELQGINVIELFTEPDMRRELIEDLRRNGFVKDKILYLRRRDTTPITVTVTAVAEFNEKGEVVFINGVVQDISESTREVCDTRIDLKRL